MEIKLLPPEVVDQIAAGEVVERPAHLVKELIENSLDAGAKRIEVEASEGGRRLKVTDDGHGLSAEDLPRALERFATSKIRTSDDLWKLQTFGFRGEALASASAVSKMTMLSRRKGDKTANRLITEFGKRGTADAIGGPEGTSVLVEELFGNVPARLKFLKSEAAEISQIRATVKAMALSRYDVEFRLHENGKLGSFYPVAKSARERVEQVLDVKPLYEGKAQREGVRASAVFAPPSEVAKTSRQIYLFAQNRWIQDRGLQAAVMDSYRSLLMHGEYPIAVVFVECETDEIDVNIHPTKSQVKFRDPSLAFRAVAASVRETLQTAPWLPQVAPTQAAPLGGPMVAPPSPFRNFAPNAASMGFKGASAEEKPLAFEDTALNTTVFAKKNEFSQMPTMNDFTSAAQTRTAHGPWSQLEVLGQLNLTYLICQSAQGMVLVDQHAAHERVAFEKLMSAWRGGRIDIQEYLFPVSVELSPEHVEALMFVKQDLEKLGLTIEPLGPSTIGVKSGPSLLKEATFAETLERTAHEVLERGDSFQFEKIVGDLCATMACHSVVRAGQALSTEQMRSLLQEMDHFPLSSFCPHGRPVSVDFSFARLEKEFGRTV